MIRLVFLGRLADLAGAPQREIAAAAPLSLAELLRALDQELADALHDARIRLAVNGTLVMRDGLIVQPGDEIAFLPPVSGG